jgi:hypothetical protein
LMENNIYAGGKMPGWVWTCFHAVLQWSHFNYLVDLIRVVQVFSRCLNLSGKPTKNKKRRLAWAREEHQSGYGKSDLNVEKKRRALSEGAERRELLMDYSAFGKPTIFASGVGIDWQLWDGTSHRL